MLDSMTANDRAVTRGARRAERALDEIGGELREARLMSALSQGEAGRRVGMSATKVGRLESGRLTSVSLWDASRLAAVLGLDLHVRLYPAGPPLRDHAHRKKLMTVLERVASPLTWGTEVPLPQRPDQPRELRAWDAMIVGLGERTAVELEMRLRDAQAVERRLATKRRDDPPDHFLLMIADTRTNRRVLADQPELFPDLPRLRLSKVLQALSQGRHPPTGLTLV